jgi:hypothetical protein
VAIYWSASASLACHSGVQNHAWSSGMTDAGIEPPVFHGRDQMVALVKI